MINSLLAKDEDQRLKIEISSKILLKLLNNHQLCGSDVYCLNKSAKKKLWKLMLQSCARELDHIFSTN